MAQPVKPQNSTEGVSGVMMTPPTVSKGMARANQTARAATLASNRMQTVRQSKIGPEQARQHRRQPDAERVVTDEVAAGRDHPCHHGRVVKIRKRRRQSPQPIVGLVVAEIRRCRDAATQQGHRRDRAQQQRRRPRDLHFGSYRARAHQRWRQVNVELAA